MGIIQSKNISSLAKRDVENQMKPIRDLIACSLEEGLSVEEMRKIIGKINIEQCMIAGSWWADLEILYKLKKSFLGRILIRRILNKT